MVTGGPGHANAVGALFTALGAESPMVLLSGHAATWELGRGGFQEIRQADMAAPVTKASWTATSAATLGRDIGEAIRIATSGRPGPGASEPAVRPARRAGREQCDRLAGCDAALGGPALADAAADAVLAAIAAARAADHHRRPAAFQRERPRAAGKARSRDRRPPSSWKARAASPTRRSAPSRI